MFDSIPGRAIWPLRAFLGITFVYAAVQKIADPGFLSPGSGSYIGSQLLAFSRGSPIGVLFQLLALPFPVVVGVATVVAELAIGALVLVGLFTRPIAIAGLLLNLVFFLSASWHVYPYFLGSDIVFVICWLTLAMTGPGPLSLDALRGRPTPEPTGRPIDRLQPRLSRWEALAAGVGTVALLALGLLPRNRVFGQSAVKMDGATVTSNAGTASLVTSSGAVRVGTLASLPTNHALAVSDPKSGDPALIVRLSGSEVYAYDAVCTHAGCTVGYDPAQKLLVCPCHGAEFDPARNAAVVAGPAPQPLTRLPITTDRQGNIYLYGTPGRPPHKPKPRSSDDG